MTSLIDIPTDLLLYEVGRLMGPKDLSSYLSVSRSLNDRKTDRRFWQLWTSRFDDDKLGFLIVEGANHHSSLLLEGINCVGRLKNLDQYYLQIAYYIYGERQSTKAMEMIRATDTDNFYPYMTKDQLKMFYDLLEAVKDELRAFKPQEIVPTDSNDDMNDDAEEVEHPITMLMIDLYYLAKSINRKWGFTIGINHYLGRRIAELLTPEHKDLLQSSAISYSLDIVESIVHGVLYHYRNTKESHWNGFQPLRLFSHWRLYRPHLIAHADRRLINELGASSAISGCTRFADKKLWIRRWEALSHQYLTFGDPNLIFTSHSVLTPEEAFWYAQKLARERINLQGANGSIDDVLDLLHDGIITDALGYGKTNWVKRYKDIVLNNKK